MIELGGRTSQDLGLGRIFGQILVYLYLREHECSLDEVCQDLGLSKAAVSVAIRQLESLGLVHRIWKKGDRKKYYRTADGIGDALREGLLTFAKQKVQSVVSELDYAANILDKAVKSNDKSPDAVFLHGRVKRARELGGLVSNMLSNPIIHLFAKS